MRFSLRPSLKAYKIITLVALLVFVSLYFLLIDKHYKTEVFNLKRVVLKNDDFINEFMAKKDKSYPVETNYERKDWHDWKFIEYERKRKGPGEQGKPFELTDPKDIELNEKLFRVEGLFVVVSDKISVNRSVPDTRLPM